LVLLGFLFGIGGAEGLVPDRGEGQGSRPVAITGPTDAGDASNRSVFALIRLPELHML
jgi:hypothetical protein